MQTSGLSQVPGSPITLLGAQAPRCDRQPVRWALMRLFYIRTREKTLLFIQPPRKTGGRAALGPTNGWSWRTSQQAGGTSQVFTRWPESGVTSRSLARLRPARDGVSIMTEALRLKHRPKGHLSDRHLDPSPVCQPGTRNRSHPVQRLLPFHMQSITALLEGIICCGEC